MFTEATIQKIRELPIADIIAGYTKVSKGKACCPIHNEKTPSFSILKGTFFKCFGCGAGGDGISFIKQVEHTDFMGAVELLARKFNVPTEYTRTYDAEAYKAKRAELKTLRDHLQAAQQHFALSLQAHPEAQQYLHGRGYDDDIIAKWQLGFAPNEWRILTERYRNTGHLPQAVSLGLVREDDDKMYDAYRNRITFPIVDEHGELLSFGGRALVKDDKTPKYLNGPQSPLYNKSAVLYGLYQAIPGIKRTGYAILTEGYTDVISMHHAGADNTIASCGTALTDEHCILLKRYTQHICIIRDADEAGLRATGKDLELLLKHGFKVEVASLPDGQDPDDYAKQYFLTEEQAA